MTFEIKNPNYSMEALEQAAAAVINPHNSTELNYKQPIADFEENANLKNDKKNPASIAGE